MNWSATTKRGELYVNELADERSADLVAVIDSMSEVGEPPNTSLDRAVRGAAGLAQTYLRRGDRAGVVALGGMLRWLRPGLGQRQLYELIDAVLDVRIDHSFVDPDIDRLPRTALPPGALVVLFSPLLDPRVVEVARDVRARGYPLVVADVLAEELAPAPMVNSDLPVRLWRLEHRVTLDSLTEVGAVVVDATGPEPLDVALAPLRRMTIPGGTR